MTSFVRARKQLHVAFFVWPQFADTVPTLSVASVLLRRGYRVSYLSKGRVAEVISELGAEVVLCESIEDFAEPEKAVSEAGRFYETNRPDIVIYDTADFVGRALAKRWQRPSIQVSCDFRLDRLKATRQAPEFKEMQLNLAPIVSDALSRLGIAGDGLCFSRGSASVYFYPKLFQLDEDQCYDTDCVYAARCAPERPLHEKWVRRERSSQISVLISTSTFYVQKEQYFKMCTEALSGLNWRIVIQLGDNNNARFLGELSPEVEIVQRQPQISILPYVDFLICAGGMMTAMEATYHGVPMLMISNGNIELEAYADNGVRLGLGIHLRKRETDIETVRRAILSMSQDSQLFDNVKKMQQLIKAEPGSEEVANLIERCFGASAYP